MKLNSLFDHRTVLKVLNPAVPIDVCFLRYGQSNGTHDGDVGVFTHFDQAAQG